MKYIVTKRYKKLGMDKQLHNLPWGTECESSGNIISYQGSTLCSTMSQDAYDYFSRDDDGCGGKRGELVHNIMSLLAKQDKQHQNRWNRLWGRPDLYRFKRSEYENYWLWNYDFYNAEIKDLEDIYQTIRGM